MVKRVLGSPPCLALPYLLRYDLDMSKPYDYMIARMLLDIANKSEGVEFTNVEYASGEVRQACHNANVLVSNMKDLTAP